MFWILFAGFFGMCAAWAVAMPVAGTTDEAQHIVRAYGVVSGQIYGEVNETWYMRQGADFIVPRSLALTQATDCMYHTEPGSLKEQRRGASCFTLTRDTSPELAGSWVGRYHPAYYAAVGWPLLLKPTYAGIIASRLLSALFSAVLLALAASLAIRLRRPLLLTGILLGVTPVAISIMGAVNPNGLEIAAGILLWTAGLAITQASDDLTAAEWRRLVWIFAMAACVMVSVRQTGPVIFGAIVVILALAAPREMRTKLIRDRGIRVAGGIVAAVSLIAVAWVITAHAYTMSGMTPMTPTEPSNMVLGLIKYRLDSWLTTTVGMFGYSETFAPPALIIAWGIAISAIMLPSLLSAARREIAVMAAIFAATAGLLAALDFRYYTVIGWSQTGRYFLALGAGLMIYSTFVHRGFGAAANKRLVLMAGSIVFVCQLFSLAMVMSRFQRGPVGGINPFRGDWFPMFGPVVPIVLLTAGVITMLYLAYRYAAAPWHKDTQAPLPPVEMRREPVPV